MKFFIKNRHGLKMAVVVETPEHPKALAFVMHGLSGNKEELHLRTFAEAFKERGFTVVRFDTTNTFGESEGRYEDATVTNYFEDLEDAIDWAKGQSWYREPFWLAGHSLGGLCIGLYAEKYPERVAALAPIAGVVSGKLSIEKRALHDADELEAWKKTGWYEEESESKPGLIKRLPWSHMEDRLKYDLLPDAGKLTMPVLLIVGDQDRTMLEVEALDRAITGPKELHVIRGAPHVFKEPEHLAEIKGIFLKWIDANLKT
ncbi:MAG: alpha/beta fold hydrolase [Patescibacteria group bacterium]|nr:alpha/beta fold hydrolase [Patescibacteria group bacterium]